MPKRDIYEGRGRTVGEVKSVWCIMSCCNHFKPLMLNISEENYSIWIDRSKKTCNMPKDMINLFFSMTMIGHLLQNQWRKSWGLMTGMCHSSNVTPSDYHLCQLLPNGLSDQHFRSFKGIEIPRWLERLKKA